MLRLKKPQPPFLSRIIRDRVKARERRITIGQRLASEIPIAEDEEKWDQILQEQFDLNYVDPQEQSWDREVGRALGRNQKMHMEAVKQNTDTSAKMYAILEQEKVLAAEENLKIRDEKHKARKARRLARRGLAELEIQGKLRPQIEETITRDPTAETEEESTQVEKEEVQEETQTENTITRGSSAKTEDDSNQVPREAARKDEIQEEKFKAEEVQKERLEEAQIGIGGSIARDW